MKHIVYILLLTFTPLLSKEYKMDRQEIITKLSPMQFKVTQKNGTEPPFKNEYWDNKQDGIYVDLISGEPLFSSKDKFKSGTGWPSFTKPISDNNIVLKEDRSWFMKRIEIRSNKGDSHLGHLFYDGPAPTGKRYCINSASLKFIPKDQLEKKGYAMYLKEFENNTTSNSTHETAYLAGGCFWGVEAVLKKIPGVIDTEVGYIGGKESEANYSQVSTKKTKHAEAVKVVFNPQKVNFEKILGLFWRLHDPTTKDRQGVDFGPQYRSAIFYTSDQQRVIAEKSKEAFDKSGVFNAKAVTEIVGAPTFYSAESYHQNYYENNGGRVCHILRKK